MNTMTIEGKFNQIKGEFKEKYGKLTNDDINIAEGNFEKFVGIVQEKYGKTREEIENEIENW